jgi:signal transduction histidine kinase
MVAGYTLARFRPQRQLRPVVVPLVVFAVSWLWHGGPLWDAVTLVGVFAAALLLGANLQMRQAYLAELEDRAERLEREREQQARLAIAAERTRIAREMHDIVAHNLAVMVALSDGAAATAPVAPQRAVDLMEKASTTGREALTEIRRLIGLLRDGEAETLPGGPGGVPPPQPGLDDLDGLIDQVRAAGLQVTLTREGAPGAWGPGAGLAVYRIVQEALTNTMRHAGQEATVEVRVRCQGAGVDVEIVDDGGRRAAVAADGRSSGGHGLTGMIERAATYGGHVTAGPGHAGGWQVQVHLPLGAGAHP